MTTPARVKRVLVAVDFDEPSGAALATAGVVAEAFGARLFVAHAASFEMPPYFTEAQVEALEAERQTMRARLAGEVRSFAARHTAVAADVLVEEGPPADTVLRLGAGVDLIVVGTHRFRGARRWWLGSVAEEVVRRAQVPVLVAPAGGQLRGGTIALYAPDGADSSAVNGWVLAFAQFLETAVMVVPQRDAAIDLIAEGRQPMLFVPAAGQDSERSAR